jgi:hypothetical protein
MSASLTRRRFLQVGAGAALFAFGAGAYARTIEIHWLEAVERPLPIRGLPDALVGRTLVQLSDLHAGYIVDDEYLIRTLDRVARWKPDIVVFTGDFITYGPHTFERLARIYRHTPRGRIATLGILGNHDYGWNWSHPEVAARVVRELAPFGIEILRNEVREVAGLQIAGLDDLWARAFDAKPVFDRLDLSRAALVLSHNPDTADLAVWNGYRGWILSGHTHGGQCRIPPFAPPILPIRNRRYAAGEVALADGRRLYVSRGIGHLLPLRFGVRPEVTRFTLQRAT